MIKAAFCFVCGLFYLHACMYVSIKHIYIIIYIYICSDVVVKLWWSTLKEWFHITAQNPRQSNKDLQWIWEGAVSDLFAVIWKLLFSPYQLMEYFIQKHSTHQLHSQLLKPVVAKHTSWSTRRCAVDALTQVLKDPHEYAQNSVAAGKFPDLRATTKQ